MTHEAFKKRCIAEAYRARAEFYDFEARRLEAQERDDAIIAAMKLYMGEPWTRAKALADDLKSYSANGWKREYGLGELPAGAPSKRRAWHRILRSRGDALIGNRQIYNICKLKSCALAISADGVRPKDFDGK